MKFLEKIHPIERLKALNSFEFTGVESNNLATPLSDSSYLFCKKNCIIQPFVTFVGSIYCEDNVFIGPYTFLRGPLYLGENVKIGPHCEVGRCVVSKNSIISHKNIILDSIIEENVLISGGTIFCNTRIDFKPVKFEWQGVKLEADKFAAYVEANVKIGVNVTAMPATYIASGKTIFGPSTIKGKNE